MVSSVDDEGGTIQEANLAEELIIDGEMYGCVKIFC